MRARSRITAVDILGSVALVVVEATCMDETSPVAPISIEQRAVGDYDQDDTDGGYLEKIA